MTGSEAARTGGSRLFSEGVFTRASGPLWTCTLTAHRRRDASSTTSTPPPPPPFSPPPPPPAPPLQVRVPVATTSSASPRRTATRWAFRRRAVGWGMWTEGGRRLLLGLRVSAHRGGLCWRRWAPAATMRTGLRVVPASRTLPSGTPTDSTRLSENTAAVWRVGRAHSPSACRTLGSKVRGTGTRGQSGMWLWRRRRRRKVVGFCQRTTIPGGTRRRWVTCTWAMVTADLAGGVLKRKWGRMNIGKGAEAAAMVLPPPLLPPIRVSFPRKSLRSSSSQAG